MTGPDFKSKTRRLKAKLREEIAAKKAAAEAAKNAPPEPVDDCDPNDWGRTASNDGVVEESDLDSLSEIESESELDSLSEIDAASAIDSLSELRIDSDLGEIDLDDVDLDDVDLDDVDLDDVDLDDEIDLDEELLEDDEEDSVDVEPTESDKKIIRELAEESDTRPTNGGADWAWPESLTPGTRTPTTTAPADTVAKLAEPAAAKPAPSLAEVAKTAPAQASAALRQELTSKSRDTTLMQLAKKGVKNVKVLGMNTIEKIVEKAVANTIERSVVGHAIEEREKIEADARKEFFKLLRKHKAVLAEQSGGGELRTQIEELSRELAQAEAALVHERRAAGTTLSPETLANLEKTFRGLLDGFMTDERRAMITGDDPKALLGLNELEKKLGETFDRLLERVKSQAEELLERRISKLNAALEETETALRHLAQSKGYDDGIASIYDSIQGIDLSELDATRKKELLSIIFVENLQIQDVALTDEDRKMYADALEALGRAPAPIAKLKAPTGFATPVETATTEVAF